MPLASGGDTVHIPHLGPDVHALVAGGKAGRKFPETVLRLVFRGTVHVSGLAADALKPDARPGYLDVGDECSLDGDELESIVAAMMGCRSEDRQISDGNLGRAPAVDHVRIVGCTEKDRLAYAGTSEGNVGRQSETMQVARVHPPAVGEIEDSGRKTYRAPPGPRGCLNRVLNG